MDRELNEQVMIERVEMIARLTTEGVCQERDREIALNLIAEIARGNWAASCRCFSVRVKSQRTVNFPINESDGNKRGNDRRRAGWVRSGIRP